MEWHCAFPNAFPAVTLRSTSRTNHSRQKEWPRVSGGMELTWDTVELRSCWVRQSGMAVPSTQARHNPAQSLMGFPSPGASHCSSQSVLQITAAGQEGVRNCGVVLHLMTTPTIKIACLPCVVFCVLPTSIKVGTRAHTDHV